MNWNELGRNYRCFRQQRIKVNIFDLLDYSMRQDSRKYVGQSTIAYLSTVICNCNDIDRHAQYRKCCLSINGAYATPVHVLFDTGADPISFVNRKVAAWIHTQRGRYGEHDNSDSMTVGIVALAGTSLTSSTNGSLSLNLTFFNELSELNEMIVSIKAKVIDSCIEVIIGRPVIRSHCDTTTMMECTEN